MCAGLIGLLLFILFFKAFTPSYIVFSNDGPLGGMVSDINRMPDILTGMWIDLNWFGGPYPPPMPDPSTALRLFTSPLYYAKLFCPFSLFVVGVCAWFCFRQYKFSSITCLLVGVAAALNSDFVGTSCWGVCSQPIAFGMNFLALGALADTTSPRRWMRVALAGFCVGLGVMEGYDIGALFSMVVAAFVVVQSFVDEGPLPKRIGRSIGRLALVSVCAGFIATAALLTLVGTQVKGIVGMGQDAESKAARWSQAVQFSIPKREALGFVVPGIFGFRGDSPDGKAYWGRGGSDPSWDEFVDSDGKTGHPQNAFRAGAGSNYPGLLVVLLAAFAVAQSLRKKGDVFTTAQRRLVWFWLAVLIVAALLMFGRFAPFYQFFYALPYASTIRNPAKFHHIVQWSLLILFAFGAQALCRVGLTCSGGVANGLGAQWKSFWAKATSFDRKWIMFSTLLVVLCGVGCLVYASSRSKLEEHLVEQNRFQYLAMGYPADQAANAASASIDSARATAKASINKVGRTLLFLIPTVGLIAITLSGYFRGARMKIGGALLLVLLVVDLFPIAMEWVVMVNWKAKYTSNSVIDFLKQRPYEQRVARFPIENFVQDTRRLPPQLAQQNQWLSAFYGYEWLQHLFPYNNIETLEMTQEPRVATEKAAYEAVLFYTPLRHWELTGTRYLIAPTGLRDLLNQQLDAEKKRFRIATQFESVPKQVQDEQRFTQYAITNGPFAVFDFTGALPRAKLFSNWKVSTNEPAKLQEWVTGLLPRIPKDWGPALASQSPTDQATLHELADPTFDPQQTVLLSEPLAARPGTNQTAGDVKISSYAPKHIVLDAKAAAPCVLLLNDKFDADWHVTVDGQPAKMLRCNFIARGVFLDKAGDHHVEFKYQPSKKGLYVSATAVLVGFALLGLVIASGRKAVSSDKTSSK